MNIPSETIPSSPSLTDRLFSEGPIAQIRSAFPEVDADPGSLLDSIVIIAQAVSVLLSVAIIVGIVIVIRRSRLLSEVVDTLEDVVSAEIPHNEISNRWDAIEHLIASEHANDWKLAVIEADKLLEFSLRHLQLEGETLAEKLKQFDRSELSVIDDVWRAHKLRNSLVHDGATVEVSQEDARRAAESMKSALSELGAIS